jgi:hypothetical protein
MTIIQRSIVFTKPQFAWLKAEAKRLGISFSEVIRRIVDKERESA